MKLFPSNSVLVLQFDVFVFFGHKKIFLSGVISRFLAKILAPEGSKDVAVGQPIAIMVSC